jgi:CBS domain-containing protein
VTFVAAANADGANIRDAMNVRDAMTPDPITCEPTTLLQQVATIMLDHDCAAVPIVSAGEVIGIVTDRDIVCRAVARGMNAAVRPASEVMSSPLVAIHPDETFEEAAQVMRENHVHHLPVIDDHGTLLGIVAQSDLGRLMSNRELGQLARATSIRGVDRGAVKLVRAPTEH